MDKLKTIGVGGFPLVLDDLRQFFGRLDSPSEGMYQAFNNLLRGFGDNFIVQGCVLGGSSGAFTLTEGWILLDGELIKVDAQSAFDEATDNTFVKSTTFNSRGTKTFLNGSIIETYEINRANISGSGGSLAFDANTFFDLSNQASSLPDTGIKILNKKIIEIGDWNMDATGAIIVLHGLTDFLKVRSITAMIINDDSTLIDTLDKFTSSNQQSEGGIGSVSDMVVSLVRKTSGIFDSTSYDSTSFNRGFITVEFES